MLTGLSESYERSDYQYPIERISAYSGRIISKLSMNGYMLELAFEGGAEITIFDANRIWGNWTTNDDLQVFIGHKMAGLEINLNSFDTNRITGGWETTKLEIQTTAGQGTVTIQRDRNEDGDSTRVLLMIDAIRECIGSIINSVVLEDGRLLIGFYGNRAFVFLTISNCALKTATCTAMTIYRF